MAPRVTSPSKRKLNEKTNRAHINKMNLMLARKIFSIMEGHSDISEMINKSKKEETHPGTLNFGQRLADAKRIHAKNMLLASKLDNIKPVYKLEDLSIRTSNTTKKKKSKKKKDKNPQAMVASMNAGSEPPFTSRSHEHQVSKLKNSSFHASANNSSHSRPNSVLLEYTKIQDNRVLDVAVLKEPYRDRYAIFGIDIDNGQRFELHLSSDDVSSILDGDILVTSVDNIEVWMALLNKVSLNKVEAFAKLPHSLPEMEQQLQKDLSMGKEGIDYTEEESEKQLNSSPPMVPIRPGQSRPSSSNRRPSFKAKVEESSSVSSRRSSRTKSPQPPTDQQKGPLAPRRPSTKTPSSREERRPSKPLTAEAVTNNITVNSSTEPPSSTSEVRSTWTNKYKMGDSASAEEFRQSCVQPLVASALQDALENVSLMLTNSPKKNAIHTSIPMEASVEEVQEVLSDNQQSFLAPESMIEEIEESPLKSKINKNENKPNHEETYNDDDFVPEESITNEMVNEVMEEFLQEVEEDAGEVAEEYAAEGSAGNDCSVVDELEVKTDQPMLSGIKSGAPTVESGEYLNESFEK